MVTKCPRDRTEEDTKCHFMVLHILQVAVCIPSCLTGINDYNNNKNNNQSFQQIVLIEDFL